MNTKTVKAKIREDAESIERAVEAEAARIGNGAAAGGEYLDELQDRLRDIGRSLRESANALADEAAKQARLRPLATFGIAMLAGMLVARALRR
jgi:ElaB/YqjD/DUF883 family membrane-anchored ribosome-binding protein